MQDPVAHRAGLFNRTNKQIGALKGAPRRALVSYCIITNSMPYRLQQNVTN